jgi:hypothetical protein
MLFTTSIAFAQEGIPRGDGPGGVPVGAGTQRGMQSLNSSGEVGFVTLFPRGARTAVVVAIEGSHGKRQRVAIVRAKSCDTLPMTMTTWLADLEGGISRSYAPITQAHLLSGNYVTVVYSNNGPKAHPVACGELYQ